MSQSIFFETEVFALAAFSLVLPVILYTYMMRKRAISRRTVLLFGVALIAMAGIDVALLQRLADMARTSPSLFDDRLFGSELSIAIYVLPLVLAGVGVNMISHILISHLGQAEKRFDRERK